MMPSYAYPISTGTLNGVIDSDTLMQSVRESSISIAISHLETQDDTIRFVFKAALSSVEQSTLTLLLAAHTGVPAEDPPQTVVIREERYGTGGQYQGKSFEINVPASEAGGEWSDLDISWPYPVSVFSAEWVHTDNMEGDVIQVLIAPNTIVGTLRAVALTGVTTLEVADSVVDNVKPGYVVDLCNNPDGSDSWVAGRVVSVDKVAKTITVEKPMDKDWTAAPLTYVRMTIEMLPHVMLRGRYVIEIGKDMIGGSYVPAGMIVRIRYQNNEKSKKIFSFIAEYKY